MHIFSYLVIIVLDVLFTFISHTDLKKTEITVIVNSVFYSVCNVILGVIVN